MLKQIKNIFTDKLLLISFAVFLLVNWLGKPQLTDINWETIGSLFALMIVVQLMNQLAILMTISDWLIKLVHSSRQFTQLMIMIAFVGAMLMTNDVAIISILPLYLATAQKYHLSILLPTVLISVAANLGSTLTPFGNPQNLFLFSNYHYSASQFFLVTGPIVLASLLLLLVLTLKIPKQPFTVVITSTSLSDYRSLIITILLAMIVLAGVFGWVPIALAVVFAMIGAIIIDRRTLGAIDYALLLTFVCFFLIAGILGRNPFITAGLSNLMRDQISTYLTAILTSQFISNVPAAVLLAKFTDDANAVLLGVNIGGLGTLVASLANLLALKQLSAFDSHLVGAFIKKFTIINAILLISLGFIGLLMLII